MSPIAKCGGNGKPGGEEKETNLHINLFLEISFCKTQLFFSTKTPWVLHKSRHYSFPLTLLRRDSKILNNLTLATYNWKCTSLQKSYLITRMGLFTALKCFTLQQDVVWWLPWSREAMERSRVREVLYRSSMGLWSRSDYHTILYPKMLVFKSNQLKICDPVFLILRALCVFPNRKPPQLSFFFPKKMKCKWK